MNEETHTSDYWFARLEGKLDRLDEKLDGAVTTLGRHEERLLHLEKAQASRSAVWLAVGVGVLAWVPNVLQLMGKG
ncbi:hypothetical protein [Amycolatopsis sp. NBC_01480]|uniref:hypothetical protein n=1 Tax=Amycolatopsis sp. NBC_01480 TaxID=2903562 RepID=UPI002E2C1730|nr:hypothetical protein [Amycolatopsis sp. NBC_01480]